MTKKSGGADFRNQRVLCIRGVGLFRPLFTFKRSQSVNVIRFDALSLR